MSKGAVATHGDGVRASHAFSPVEAITDLLHRQLSARGDCEVIGLGPGWLMLSYRGRTFEIDVKPAFGGSGMPRLVATDDEPDEAPSDQFPAIPAGARLPIASCEDCGSEPVQFSIGDDGEATYTLDFRRTGGD